MYFVEILFISFCLMSANCIDNNCVEYAKNIHHCNPVISYDTPNPMGDWVSTRCEITPNKRYIVRRFIINNQKWFARIYHYSDSWCKTPSFTVKIEGTYEMLPATATPNSITSFASLFNFQKIYFRSSFVNVLEESIDFVLKKCPEALPQIVDMQNGKKLNLVDYVDKYIQLDSVVLSKKYCRNYFTLHPSSFKKIWMTGVKKRLTNYDKLYFADFPTLHTKQSKTYLGKKFQYGLVRIVRSDCVICKYFKSDYDLSPKLSPSIYTTSLSGDWVTQSCTAIDDTTFITQYYELTPTGKGYGTFTLYEYIFSDSNCKVSDSYLKSGGSYKNIIENKVHAVFSVDLKVTSLTLTIFNDGTLEMAKEASSCGVSGKWKHGVEQNVTSTNGCSKLGYTIPVTNKMLARIDKSNKHHKLYFDIYEEGIFFSWNLVQCFTVDKNIAKPVTTMLPTQRVVNSLPTNKFYFTVPPVPVANYANSSARITTIFSYYFLFQSLLVIMLL